MSRALWLSRSRGERRQSGGASPHPRVTTEWASDPGRGHRSRQQQAPAPRCARPACQARGPPPQHPYYAPPGKQKDETFQPLRINKSKRRGEVAERTGTTAWGPGESQRKLPDPIVFNIQRSSCFPVAPGRAGWGERTPSAAAPRAEPRAAAHLPGRCARRARGRAPASWPGPRRRLPCSRRPPTAGTRKERRAGELGSPGTLGASPRLAHARFLLS